MEATTFYLDAVAQLEKVEEENADANKLQVTVLQNMSNCFLRLKEFNEVIAHCTAALKIDSAAVKALYFRSQAYAETKDMDEAIKDVVAAIKLDL